MNRFLYVFGLWSLAVICVAGAAKLFDEQSCSNGCEKDSQCPADAACVALQGGTACGVCLCRPGYKAQGARCVKNNKLNKGAKGPSKATTSTQTPGTVPTTESAAAILANVTEATFGNATLAAQNVTSSVGSTTTGTATQNPVPPPPEPLNCGDYDCSVQLAPSNDSDPFLIRSQIVKESPTCKRKIFIQSRPCNVKGGGQCYGDYCLTIAPANDYCICQPYREGRTCTVDKPGTCVNASGQPQSAPTQGMRYVHKTDPDHGSVIGRHFAVDVTDCIKLCQWEIGCKSVNFGKIQGANVCDLLSVAAIKGSPLFSWLQAAEGYQYAVVRANAIVL